MELEHEKFEGAKELAEIGVMLSQTQAALGLLQGEEVKYLAEREERVTNRIQKALADSAELITKIGENHTTLVAYRIQVTELHEFVMALLKSVTDCMDLLTTTTNELDKRIGQHQEDMRKFAEETKKERITIEESNKSIEIEKGRIKDSKRDIASRYGALQSAVADMEKRYNIKIPN